MGSPISNASYQITEWTLIKYIYLSTTAHLGTIRLWVYRGWANLTPYLQTLNLGMDTHRTRFCAVSHETGADVNWRALFIAWGSGLGGEAVAGAAVANVAPTGVVAAVVLVILAVCICHPPRPHSSAHALIGVPLTSFVLMCPLVLMSTPCLRPPTHLHCPRLCACPRSCSLLYIYLL